jgi:hypothetical protein
MANNTNLMNLAARIQSLAATKQDFVADTRSMEIKVPADDRIPTLSLDNGLEYPVSEYAQNQMAAAMDIPKGYWQKMRNEAPALLETNANHWLQNEAGNRMVRTIAPVNNPDERIARAYLSDRYARIDHEDVMAASLEALESLGYQPLVKTAELTDKRMYMEIVFPALEGEIKLNDPVQAGIIISNGEIGNGAIQVAPIVYRLVCLNGMIVPKDVAEGRMRKTHVGKKLELGEVIYAQDTMDAENKATMLKMRDAVKQIASEPSFDRLMTNLRALAEGPQIKNPIKAAEQMAKTLALPQIEQNGWLESLIRDGDYSRWGALNAVTQQAHKTANVDRQIELETLGGKVMTLPASDWRRIAEAA